MDGLREDVSNKARSFISEYIVSHIDKNNLFRSTGKAYIQLAKEEPYILKTFILQERKNILSLSDLYETETNPQMAEIIAEGLDISVECAKQLCYGRYKDNGFAGESSYTLLKISRCHAK